MSWTIEHESEGVVIATFAGYLTADDGDDSAREFCNALGEEAKHVIWDVRRMDGYDSAARKAWQKWLFSKRHLIRSITLVGGSALMRMGAGTIAFALGIECDYVGTLEEATGRGSIF